MTSRKFAVSFPDELYARAQSAAAESGMSLSAWLGHAAEHELRRSTRVADGLAAVAEFEAEHGDITVHTADRSWVADVLASATDDQRLAG